MRFDKEIYMQSAPKRVYDELSGDYIEEKPKEVKLYADVTDAKSETINIIYGQRKQGVLVIRLQQHYAAAFEFIRIGSRRYRVDYERRLRHKHVFVVSEVQ